MGFKSNRLIFGCCKLAKNNTKSESIKLLNYAHQIGIKYFDTAPLYSKGYSELLIGEVFKNKKSIYVTTKVGTYKTPQTFIPAWMAIPLNKILKNSYKENNSKKSLFNDLNFINQPNNFEKHLKEQILSSVKRLKISNIEAILIHEYNPYKLDLKFIDNIYRYISEIGIAKLGYGGALHRDFLQTNIPSWIEIVQIPLPKYDSNFDKILKFISKNNNKEFRFFNLFKEPEYISKKMKQAKKLLLNFPNTKIIFQTSSLKRLKENIDFFNS